MKIAWTIVAAAAAALLAGSDAHSEPVIYSGSLVASGSIGRQAFSDAPVRITFRGDTRDVAALSPATDGVNGWRILTGTARIRIELGARVIRATLLPASQVFVSFDLDNGGVGFGSAAYGPLYPLAFYGREVALSACAQTPGCTTDPELARLKTDLRTEASLGGLVTVCAMGAGMLPGVPCLDPAQARPLATDRGDLVLQMAFNRSSPYVDGFSAGAQVGFFDVRLPARHREQDGIED